MSGLSFLNNANFEGNLPSISTPGIYEAKLIDFSVKNITDKEGNLKFENTLQFTFELTEGKVFNHIEFPPKDIDQTAPLETALDDDGKKKFSGLYSRVGHILKHYCPQEMYSFKELPETTSWIDLCSLYQTASKNIKKQAEAGELKPIFIKISGNVYNGKARLGFTNYLGFTGEQRGSVEFSKKEAESNAEYLQFEANKEARSDDPMAANLPGSDPAGAGMPYDGQDSPF